MEPLEIEAADLICSDGVLGHVNPSLLNRVHENLARCSHRYVLIAEYN